MTPPPNSIPWRNSPPSPFMPLPSDSFSDGPYSMELQFLKRPSDPSADPTFIDLVDALDAMMAPSPIRISTSRKRWNGYKAYLVNGSQIIDWLLQNSFATTVESAADFATHLVRKNGFLPTFKVDSADKSFQPSPRFAYVHRGLSLMCDHGLNVSVAYPGKQRHISLVLTDLNLAFAQICHTSVAIDAHFVEYSSIRGSAPWRNALVLLTELAFCDHTHLHDTDENLKKSAFYNLYNLLIFHAKLVYGHPTDLLKRSKFFNEAAYIIAGKKITSIELEHYVCRKTMPADDIRSSFMLKEQDARMHFVLNCGAQSCPPLQPLEAHNLDAQLHKATVNFIDQHCEVDFKSRRVTLSRLWKWFRPDFTPSSTSDHDLIQWITKRASKTKAAELSQLAAADYKLKFAPYNWADNGDVNAKPDIRFMAVYDHSFSRSV